MGSLPVIEHLDVIEDARSGFFPGGEPVVVDQLTSNAKEECIIVLVSVLVSCVDNFKNIL
jgi:hypothetical protein